jgi:hypothetical protein
MDKIFNEEGLQYGPERPPESKMWRVIFNQSMVLKELQFMDKYNSPLDEWMLGAGFFLSYLQHLVPCAGPPPS